MPKTSGSSRPRRTLDFTIESKGITKSIVVAKKEGISDLRAIHSSQKNRNFRKMLNIEGNRLSAR